ncbi:MAG: hypothetical protein J5934_08795 [Succinivibrio sp.]|nr:hypothetical protein [Succinivibrio sp.]
MRSVIQLFNFFLFAILLVLATGFSDLVSSNQNSLYGALTRADGGQYFMVTRK